MPDPSYDALGEGYAQRRRADPRIASMIHEALGDAITIINVGAGTGSYEPRGRTTLAVEPSETMIAQRAPDAAPCMRGSAEALPAETAAFDAAMAILTIHHWSDWRAGLHEMRRVARRRIVLLTFDTETSDFWLTRDYVPALMTLDRRIMPLITQLESELGPAHTSPVPVPHDCIDGFLGAYWRRPHTYLDPIARRSMSSFARIDAADGLERLERDLANGAWHVRNSDLLTRDALDVGYRLLHWEFSP